MRDTRVVVAVTGGIGAGKSTLGRHLEALGALRIDADESARAALEPGSGAASDVGALFPECVHDGRVDRAALAAVVFAAPERRQALEAIVHPWVRADIQVKVAAAAAQVVVVEVPLLAETRSRAVARTEFNYVVDVWAPLSLRAERAVAAGLPPADFDARVRAQASDTERFAVADLVVPNATSPDALRAHAPMLLARLRVTL